MPRMCYQSTNTNTVASHPRHLIKTKTMELIKDHIEIKIVNCFPVICDNTVYINFQDEAGRFITIEQSLN